MSAEVENEACQRNVLVRVPDIHVDGPALPEPTLHQPALTNSKVSLHGSAHRDLAQYACVMVKAHATAVLPRKVVQCFERDGVRWRIALKLFPRAEPLSENVQPNRVKQIVHTSSTRCGHVFFRLETEIPGEPTKPSKRGLSVLLVPHRDNLPRFAPSPTRWICPGIRRSELGWRSTACAAHGATTIGISSDQDGTEGTPIFTRGPRASS